MGVRYTDPMLQLTVDTAERSDFEIDLILTVSGLLISGKLISYKDYLSLLGDIFAKAGQAEVSKALADGSHTYESSGEKSDFIHLKDTMIRQGTYTVAVGPWRGRLADIESFVFGRLKS